MEMTEVKKQSSTRLEQTSTPEWPLPEGSTASGKVRIDGRVDGAITANDSVVIGESAMITGDVKAVSIIVSGTVRGDLTGSERIEIHPSAKVFGKLIAPQVVGQGAPHPEAGRRGAQDPQVVAQGAQGAELFVFLKRTRMWRVVVPAAALAATGVTLLIFHLPHWRSNAADESVKLATLRAKSGPAHATRQLSPLSGSPFAHNETSRATLRPAAPKPSASIPSASREASSKVAAKVPTADALAAFNESAYGPTSATTGALSLAAPNAPVSVSPSNLIIEIPYRVPAPLAHDYTVRGGRKDRSAASGSAISALPSTHAKAIASNTGHRTHASSFPVELRVPRIANAGFPSPLVKHSNIGSESQGTEATVPAGIRITISNWRQYQAFMPDGMKALFSGKYGLKMPNDIEIDVGPQIHIVTPGSFRQASEKYSGEAQVVHLPNGRNDIANYVAGEPFPIPQGPDKGYEILANLWYTYSPHLAVGMAGFWNVTKLDRFGNATTARWDFVYRQLAFNTDPGVPRTDPRSAGAFYTQWLMTEEPEQAKYTTDLDILPQNAQQNELNYIFLPTLRRSLSVSVSSRCAPLLGTDWTHDDQKPGFNGGLADFNADYLRNMKMLALVDLSKAVSDFPREYDMPLGFARPSWGNWSLRDVWVINIHRIPSKAAGYCYAKRIEYIDKETVRSLWTDLYDYNRNLWKVTMSAYHPRKVPGTDGDTIYGRFAATTWDLQNQHATLGNSTDPSGRLIMFNTEVPHEFDNVTEYSTPSGLMQIMR
jgi:Protein of unknown function (DUF1329)/Polymer-forming cytoskeletal